MPTFFVALGRLYNNHVRTGRLFTNWRLPFYLFIFVFFTSWGLMAIAEPHNPLIKGQNFFWYFTVTATTVGYGDYFPHTEFGHIVGEFFVVGSITCGTVLLGYIINLISNYRDRSTKGLVAMRLSGHIVIIGYRKNDTRRLVELLQSQMGSQQQRIVLCASEEVVSENPLHDIDGVDFIRGEHDDERSHAKAGPIAGAEFCIVDLPTDHEAMVVLLRLSQTAPNVRLAATVSQPDKVRSQFDLIGAGELELVSPTDLALLADIATTRGVGRFVEDFKCTGGSVNSETMIVPHTLAGTTVSQLNHRFGEDQGFAVLWVITRDGVQENLPAGNRPLEAGETVGYAAAFRLDQEQLERIV